jgi:hypothetical protein
MLLGIGALVVYGVARLVTDRPRGDAGSRGHGASEFGRSTASSIAGLDPPMIGASASIMIDGMVERESGATPPPPVVSVNAMIVGLIVMFLVGLALVFFVFGPK